MYISLCGVITCVQYTIFYYIDYVSTLKGNKWLGFGDMGLIELRKTHTFQPQSHF